MAGVERARRRAVLAALRDRLARIETRSALGRGTLSLGPGLDPWLPEEGLTRGALHEILPRDRAAPASATGFAVLALTRLDPAMGPVLWLARAGASRLSGRGLVGLGLDPGRMILVTPATAQDLLWAAEEALRCSGVGAVVIELGTLGLTPARRLALAAEAGGTLGLLLRDEEGAAACRSRWRVGAMPGVAGQDWQPRLTVALERGRGAAPREPAAMLWQGPARGFVQAARADGNLDRPARVI